MAPANTFGEVGECGTLREASGVQKIWEADFGRDGLIFCTRNTAETLERHAAAA